ncbi:hypothetical protein H4Q26_010343 [Puccinia striiformis f. sp. tritici PST-130]|nr:hypothetical protein H4Q26_010343 [Puccinia striiformis f. sp. tritici PST-130]
MSKPNNTNTTHPSYAPPSPDPRFVSTPEFYPPCVKCSTLELVCGQSTKAAGKGKADKCEKMPSEEGSLQSTSQTSNQQRKRSSPKSLDRSKNWRNQRYCRTMVYWEKTTEPSPSDLSVHSPRFALLQAASQGKLKRTREQLEEDEILQEVLEEEAAIARLTEAAKNQEPVAGPSKRLRLIVASTPNTEEDVNPEEDEFKEAERGRMTKDKVKKKKKKRRGRTCRGKRTGKRSIQKRNNLEGNCHRRRGSYWKSTRVVVAEKEVSLAANKVPEEKDRLFDWSSDDERKSMCTENPRKR